MSNSEESKSSDRRGFVDKAACVMSGAEFIAETFKGYGITHVFFVDGILRRALAEMERLGIRRVLTHSEEAAAYMADGYSRVGRRPGICMSQSVGAANLAAGLQDAFLGLSAVIAFHSACRHQYSGRQGTQLPDRPIAPCDSERVEF